MTEIKYYVSWKSDTQSTRKEAYFDTLWGAETWYNEKLIEFAWEIYRNFCDEK